MENDLNFNKCTYGNCTRKIWMSNPLARLKKCCNEHWQKYENPKELTFQKLVRMKEENKHKK